MPPLVDPDTAVIVLWGVAALSLAWTWIPALLAALGYSRYYNGGSEDHDFSTDFSDPGFAFWADQLEPLGYEPLGKAWMRLDFVGHQWTVRVPVRVFLCPAKRTYAFMTRAPSPFDFWPGVIFATCFADGGLLLSDNNLTANPEPDDEYIRQGVVTLDAAELEAYHLATLEVLGRMGRRPESDMSLNTLLRATAEHCGPEAARTNARSGSQYLFAHGMVHLCASLPAAVVAGLDHWFVPLANLGLAVMMMFGESTQKRQYAQAVSEAMRSRDRARRVNAARD